MGESHAEHAAAGSHAARTNAAQVLDQTLDAFVEVAPPDWRVVFINQRALASMGAEEQDVLGKTLFELSPHTKESPVLESLERVARTGAGERFETFSQLLGRWLEVQLSPFGCNVGAFFRDVTERRDLEERLRESEQRLDSVLESIDDHVVMYDLDWRYVFLNEKAARVLGKTKSELIGRCIWEIYPDAVGNQYYRELHQARDEQRVIRSEHYYAPFETWYENHIYPWKGGVTVFSSEITWRKRAEDSLRTSERRFALFMSHLPGLAWIKHQDGQYLFANEAAARAFGRPASEVLGHTDAELFPPETAARFRENDLLALASAEGHQTLETLEHPDGSLHTSIVSKFPIPGEGDELMVGGMAIDITARIEAERALRESEERFRELANSIPAIVWMATNEGQTFFLNRWYYEFTGLPAESRGEEGWSVVVHPEDRSAAFASWARSMSEGKTWEHELRLLRGDGEYRWFLTRYVPLHDAEGNLRQWLGTSVDVHDRKVAEAELERRVQARTAELAAANEEMEGFTYSVSHDLRAPVRNIIATSRILQQDFGEALPPQAAELLEGQARSANRLGELIDELLRLSRLGRYQMSREQVDLSALASDVVEELKTRWPCESMTFKIARNLHAIGDPTLLRLVLENLIENACKFSPKGGCIEVGSQAPVGPSPMVFFVRDEGVGFDMKYAHKLFLPFERLVKDEEFPGTGIGLANVERIVRRHGGRVWAQSELGRGSTFFFTLG